MAQQTGKPDTTQGRAADGTGKVGGIDKRVVAGVAGIAVGSAAIAAALLFTSRYVKARPAVPPPSDPEVPEGPRTPDASDIRIA